MKKLEVGVFWTSLLLTVASFGGAVHGLGDSLAVFRQVWAIGLSVSSLFLLRGHLRLAGLGALVLIILAAPFGAAWVSADQTVGGRYSHYQKNLRYDGRSRQAIIDDILAADPDFITLEEISVHNMMIFDALAEKYPTSLFCRFTGVGGVGVLSKFPLVEGGKNCVGEQGPAAIKVTTPDGPVWTVALHLHWPYPYSQREQVSGIVNSLGFLDAPVVLGGDFNMVPWSDTMRRIEKATGSKRAGRVLFTFRSKRMPLLRLPIDHVLVPSGRGKIERRPMLGSDHFGVLLRFDL